MTIRCCLLAFLLAGCAGPAATAPGSAIRSAPPSAAVTTWPASERPMVSSGPPGASLPPLPSGFPIHDSMRVRESEPGAIAHWTSDALPPDLYAFYLGALAGRGFEIDLEAPGGAAAMLRFHARNGTPYQLDFTGSGPVDIVLGPPHP